MQRRKQYGGVSLFIVTFVAMIVAILTVSFTQLMVRTQDQTSENDLSQRAYDSALAGVEDAKRVILACQAGNSQACTAMESAECDTVQSANVGVSAASGEVQVGTSDDNQAYTCVKINAEGIGEYTTEYIDDGKTTVVPIETTSAFNRVTLTWYSMGDANHDDPNAVNATTLVQTRLDDRLPTNSLEWGAVTTPPLLRAAFADGRVTGDSFDGENVQTGFFIPSGGNPPVRLLETSGRREAASSPLPAGCVSQFGDRADGVCSVTFRVRSTTSGYLLLTPRYHGTTVTVSVGRKITGIIPVDSTGRADGVFRRVKANVVVTGGSTADMPGIYVDNNICKTFSVADQASLFSPGDCDPTLKN